MRAVLRAWLPAAMLLSGFSAAVVDGREPAPIIFDTDTGNDIEDALAIRFPARSIEEDFAYGKNHPIADACRAYKQMPYDRPTWDLTSVLYAIRPERDYFSLSPPGVIVVDNEGKTRLEEKPGGKHRYLIVNETQKPRILEALTLLASQPPKGL
jgi:inosine-uridine nucleoside N-ribohydrolase